jgi:hypothetical protein
MISPKRIVVPTMLAVALVAVALLLRGKGRLASTPEESVRMFLQSAQRGNTRDYLANLTGTLRASSESTQSQMGDEAFAASLRKSVAGMKGCAISSVGAPSADRTELDVEIVFSDRNERQRFILLQQNGAWLIQRIDNTDTVKPPVPYGAPVFDTGG